MKATRLITPDEIKTKALKKYRDVLRAGILDNVFFPLEISFAKIKSKDALTHFSELSQQLEILHCKSKNKKGYGYTIEYIEQRNRNIGRQQFPARIYFSDSDDYLKFTGKSQEYNRFIRNSTLLVNTFSELTEWALENTLKIIQYDTAWPDIIKIVQYFKQHPCPGLYIRELPIEIDTKFLENHKDLVRALLDHLIPEHVNQDETVFEKRFNLKYNQPLVRTRILDKDISKHSFCGLSDISIPLDEFTGLNIRCDNIIILENKTNFSNIFNFLSLPQLSGTIALFGKGFAAGVLGSARWMNDKNIYYWGDIDIHGFMILSMLRSHFPEICSIMMDMETFSAFENYAVTGPTEPVKQLPNLTQQEEAVFRHLLSLNSNNRLEQEKIPHAYAVSAIRKYITCLQKKQERLIEGQLEGKRKLGEEIS